MKKFMAFLLLFALTAAGTGGYYLYRVHRYKSAVAEMQFSGVEIAAVPDGVYSGECDVDFIAAKVQVAVKDGVITAIDLLEHYNDRGGAAGGIEQRIVAEQQVDVDAVSGATNSSTVIKKAVDNALAGALAQ